VLRASIATRDEFLTDMRTGSTLTGGVSSEPVGFRHIHQTRAGGRRRESMVHVTERARELFTDQLDHASDGPDLALRIGATAEGLGVFPDTRKDDDQVIEHQGKTILVFDREVSEVLAGRTIDVEEHSDGAHLVLRK
jgi:Fe-S cluster assembly iron-binding protein IscA